ncbi:hypothetical protein Dimus_022191 [Dionaea muscipula]
MTQAPPHHNSTTTEPYSVRKRSTYKYSQSIIESLSKIKKETPKAANIYNSEHLPSHKMIKKIKGQSLLLAIVLLWAILALSFFPGMCVLEYSSSSLCFSSFVLFDFIQIEESIN